MVNAQQEYIKYHIKLLLHIATSWGTGASSTKQRSLTKRAHFHSFRYIRYDNAKNRVLAPKSVCLRVFKVSLSSQALLFSVFPLGVARSALRYSMPRHTSN